MKKDLIQLWKHFYRIELQLDKENQMTEKCYYNEDTKRYAVLVLISGFTVLFS